MIKPMLKSMFNKESLHVLSCKQQNRLQFNVALFSLPGHCDVENSANTNNLRNLSTD